MEQLDKLVATFDITYVTGTPGIKVQEELDNSYHVTLFTIEEFQEVLDTLQTMLNGLKD